VTLGARLLLFWLGLALAACTLPADSAQDHPYRHMPTGPIGTGGF